MGTLRSGSWIILILAWMASGCGTPETVAREPAASALPTRPGPHSTPPILQPPPSGAEWEFPRTDFRRSLVSFDEILPGGPPRDGIPAIDHPRFVRTPEADPWLKPNEPVILVHLNGEARAYPLDGLYPPLRPQSLRGIRRCPHPPISLPGSSAGWKAAAHGAHPGG